MSYSNLGEFFPHLFIMPKEEVMELVHILLVENREDVTNGSSFAVTTDAQDGYWRIWLSATSYKYLLRIEARSIEAASV